MQPETPTDQPTFSASPFEQPTVSLASNSRSIAPVWHTVLLIVLFSAPMATLFWGSGSDAPARPRTFAGLTVELLFCLVMFLYVRWGLRLRKTPLNSLFGRKWDFFEDGLQAVLIGSVVAGLIVIVDLALMRLGSFYYRHHFSLPHTNAQFAFATAIMFAVGFTEELTFRGYLQIQFERWGVSPAVAMLMQSFIFALAHGGAQTLIGLLSKFLSGLIFTWTVKRTGSLIPAILAHSFIDVGAMVFYWFSL